MANYSLRQTSVKTFRKVPQIALIFWILKLLTTAMGESTSDFFVLKYNPYLAVAAGGIVLLIALIIQIRLKRYIAWAYWFAVSMVAVFGTMAADGLHKQLGVPYAASTAFFAVVLAIIFIIWRASEKTLSIHSINTRRRELFYWATVLATFALGTAAGDLAATKIVHGYFVAGLVFGAVMLIPIILYYVFHVSEVLVFWFAYILTRPLGASFADWIGKSKAVGGLGYGEGRLSIILALIIIALVTYLSISKADVEG